MAVFDLAHVSDSSPLVKNFSDAIAKATEQIVVSFVAQKMKKTAGIATKDLDFNLENGQLVTLVVRTDGDVIRVKINGKDTPIKNELFHFSADSFTVITPKTGNNYNLASNESDRKSLAAIFAKAVAEIAAYVVKGQAAFDKRCTQQKIIPPKEKNSSGSGRTSVATSTKEVQIGRAHV